MSNLEYLRGEKLQMLQNDNLKLKQQMKLQQLDYETYNKSL